MLSVGIWGAAGYMGAPFSRALLKAHRRGLLRFVILHRPESDLGRYPADIEKRRIDLDDGEVASATEEVRDLQVVISAVSWRAHESQYRLIDALKGSERLVTFFPSEYATPHTAEDLMSPDFTDSREKEKKEQAGAVLAARRRNEGFNVNLSLLSFVSCYTFLCPRSKEFSGQALVYLLLHRLADLPNRSFSLVEISFGARDLITLFTKLHHGQEPTIVKYTEEDYQRDLRRDYFGAMGATSKKGVAVGAKWPEEIVSGFPGWQERTLEEYVKECLATEPLTFENRRESTDLSKD
ncbi:hypothetical protein C8F04DRAFT_1228913 [Mycena alexandri]|uniref:NmrA-like domain-containing protein n=1 Tax=Mycena alexandri TaxID=1745969 RepID=A0AAD6XDJ9_9AGAR|nr:hypothetical protein C8F04DRAFT_1228913 [Mycena alexandri]